jgi:2-oxoisovalerate dehydrogenase E2 component (dihydrolipoyl transacylase)
MAIREFPMPDLAEGLTEGEIVEWHVKVGEPVALNQTLCVVETAKAAVDVPSPFAGTVIELCGKVGDLVPVGAPLIRIDTSAGEVQGEARPDESSGVGEQGSGAAPAASSFVGLLPAGTKPVQRRLRRPEPAGPTAAAGSTRHAGRATVDTGQRGTTSRPASALAKPPIRKLANDLGVDLKRISGSGPDGTVTRADVLAAASGGGQSAPEAATPPVGFRGFRPGQEIPLKGIRARIAEKMTTANQLIPTATTRISVDCSRLLETRQLLNRQVSEEQLPAVNITPLVLILRATVLALRRFPMLNASIDTRAAVIRLHDGIHLGFATDTERGLLVPVVHDAERLTVFQLGRQVAELAEAARSGSITPGQLTGGTFTVTNAGPFGVDDGDPIINHPEVAILGIGTIRNRPIVDGNQIVARPTVTFTLAFDHRVCDGAESGRFVSYLAELVSEPTRMLIHG